ncbi:hypothetical protein QKQ66_gp097 [Dione juno nucleopolyhedrovirus]|uniref:Uncharacterized protein n=1 Tax=Dione juno nucleopolyhedrovirus TaxID=2594175 RepID=A0AAE6LC78_9ABAC|nr:hypothetical protein QKQ66_gp097 [Dione juno nucleopolyhedrovirus]QDL56983.1 hypothetical protein DijuNPV-ORF-97 [Dione juno nucleopolyhedrovirus]
MFYLLTCKLVKINNTKPQIWSFCRLPSPSNNVCLVKMAQIKIGQFKLKKACLRYTTC